MNDNSEVVVLRTKYGEVSGDSRYIPCVIRELFSYTLTRRYLTLLVSLLPSLPFLLVCLVETVTRPETN